MENLKPEEIEMEERQKKINESIKKECFECGSKNTICSEKEMKCNSCGGYFVYGN